MLRVLELGNYIVPAYAGMVLAEQGHRVVKWTHGRDPIHDLNRGDEIWAWVNDRKVVIDRDARELPDYLALWAERDEAFDACDHDEGRSLPDVIIDNFLPATLFRWGIDPVALALRYGLIWVSMRGEDGGRSFDVVAQARAWGDFAPWAPFWIGDTSGGLWLAFKALSMHARGVFGHQVLGQASCLAKLVEGELVVEAERTAHSNPFERDAYYMNGQRAVVEYKGQQISEPRRDHAWRLANLWHEGGRIKI